MDIEVKQSEGGYAKASVKSLSKDGVTVSYEKDWKPSETIPCAMCRIPLPANSTNNDLKVGQTIEAYFEKKPQSHPCWHQVKLQDIKGELAIIQDIENPDSTKVVEITECRPFGMTQQLDANEIYHHEIPVAAGLHDYFLEPTAFNSLHAFAKDIFVAFDKEKSLISVWTFSPASIQSVKLLSDMFITTATQKFSLLRRKQEAERASKPPTVIDDPSLFKVSFKVDKDLMGLAIGTHSVNLAEARKVDGVVRVIYDEANKETDGFCTFTIQAKSQEAAEKARELLEYLTDSTQVPRSMVGKIVGQSGEMLQEIIRTSGVNRIKVQGAESRESEFVGISFMGTRKSVEAAKSLISFYVCQLKDMDVLRGELGELDQKFKETGLSSGNPDNQQNRGGNQRRPVEAQNNQNRRNQQRSDGQNSQRGPKTIQLSDFFQNGHVKPNKR